MKTEEIRRCIAAHLRGPQICARGKVILFTYLGRGSIHKEIGRILRKIEYWHQGSITSFRILYQDTEGIGGEVKWNGETRKLLRRSEPASALYRVFCARRSSSG